MVAISTLSSAYPINLLTQLPIVTVDLGLAIALDAWLTNKWYWLVLQSSPKPLLRRMVISSCLHRCEESYTVTLHTELIAMPIWLHRNCINMVRLLVNVYHRCHELGLSSRRPHNEQMHYYLQPDALVQRVIFIAMSIAGLIQIAYAMMI